MRRFGIIFYSFILFLFHFSSVIAQKAPMKWGKVEAEDLAMTTYPLDSQANAVVLCDFGTYTFEFGTENLIYQVRRHTRIKILNKAGFNEGDVTINYNRSNGFSMTVKAQVIQPDGTIEQIPKKEIFDEKVYEGFHRKRIAFPNLQEGSIIEYEYRHSSPYLIKLPTWYFQDDIPTRHSELRVTMPEWFKYAQMVQGYEQLASNDTKNRPLNTRYGTVDSDFDTYIAKDIPALRREPYITTMRDYFMRIKFQLQSYTIPGVTYKTYMTNWNDIATRLIEANYFGMQYLKTKYSKDLIADLKPLLSEVEDKAEKLAIIYQYLANKIAWDGTYDYGVDQNIDKSYTNKSANSAEMTFMLIAALRAYGIEAFPILTSTRDYGKMFPIYPFLDQFNHVLTVVLIDDKAIMIDIPDRNRPFDLLGVNSLNRKGLLVTDTKSADWIDIKPSNQRNVMMATLKLDEEGAISGEIQCNYKGYNAVEERRLAKADKEGTYWTSRLEEANVDAQISNVSYENLKISYKPLKEKMNCEMTDFAQVVDDYIYVSPIFYATFMKNPFKIEKRLYPIDMPYPINEQIIVNLEIPEGYAIEDVPQGVNMSLPEGAGKFKFSVSTPQEGMIQLIMHTQVKKLLFLPSEYAAVKNFFDILVEKQQEQIVLKKIEE